MRCNLKKNGEKIMSRSFEYGLKARFYGLFSQLPWSMVITALILFPLAYNADQATKELIIELTLYWALIIGVLFFFKDLHVQRKLLEFSIQGKGISIYLDKEITQNYSWEELRSVEKITKKDSLSRKTLEGEGVLLKFSDGFELPVFDKVSNFELFRVILKQAVA